MPNGEGGGPQIELSDKDKEMLGRHAEALQDRAGKSVGWQEKEKLDKEWVIETPPVHRGESVGSSRDVKRGDKADMVGRGSRHDSHPIGNEKIPLK